MQCQKKFSDPNAKNYQVGTFNQAVVKQNQIDTSGAS